MGIGKAEEGNGYLHRHAYWEVPITIKVRYIARPPPPGYNLKITHGLPALSAVPADCPRRGR
jgi:hypothetical protein